MNKWKMLKVFDSSEARIWNHLTSFARELMPIVHNGTSVITNTSVLWIKEITMESLDE